MDRDALHKKTYTNWANYCLRNTQPLVQITDIYEEIPDGVTLIKLLMVLTDKEEIKNLRYKENPANPFQVIANLEEAFKFMKEKDGVRIEFVGPRNLAGHTLALMWILILHYHFGITSSGGSGEQGISSAKKLLLGWIQAALPDRNIANLNTNWSDGHNLVALVNRMKPGLIANTWNSPLERVTEAMKVAFEVFGIPQIIQPEDICVDHPDELSVVSYLYYFCNKNSVGSNSLLEWIRGKIPNRNVTNFTTDWKDGISLACLVNAVSEGQFPEHKDMTPTDPLTNITRAMEFAETLGVPRTTTPEEFIDPKLDQMVTLTYLMYFQYAVPPLGKELKEEVAIPEPISEEAEVVPEQVQEAIPEQVAVVDPAKCKATGDGLKSCIVGETSSFIVTNCESDDIEVAIQGPTTSVDFNVTKLQSEGGNSIEYIPMEIGEHTINVEVAGQPINGSPFSCKSIDPKKCFFVLKPDKGLVGQTLSFQIDAAGAGEGELVLNAAGPKGNTAAASKVSRNGPEGYLWAYTPTEDGWHSMECKFDGVEIPGSPFKVLVASCRVYNLPRGFIRVLEEASFMLDIVSGSVADLEISDNDYNSCVISPVNGDTHKVTFVPNKVGTTVVNVMYANQPVPGSPIQFAVNDPSKCTVDTSLQYATSPGVPLFIPVSTKFAGKGEVTAMANDTTLEVTNNGDTQVVRFVLSKEGTFDVRILFDGCKVPGTPIKVVIEKHKGVENIKVSQPGGEAFLTNTPHVYKFDASDANEGALKANCCGLKKLTNVPIDIKDEGNYQYTLSVSAAIADEYQVNVLWNNQHVPGSPFRISISSPLPSSPEPPPHEDDNKKVNLVVLSAFGFLYYFFLFAHENLYK